MILSSNYRIVDIADEYLAVPVGEEAAKNRSVITLSNAGAFLLKQMYKHKKKEDLVQLLIDEYELDRATAEKDLEVFLDKLVRIGLIIN